MSRDETLAALAAYRRWLLAHPDQFLLAGTLSDIDNARNTGRLAISFDIEGINALAGDINMVEVYHSLGVRQMLFAYNLNNSAAGGCHDIDIPLTKFGIEVLAEMNRVGMIVDASHVGYSSSMELIERSCSPPWLNMVAHSSFLSNRKIALASVAQTGRAPQLQERQRDRAHARSAE